MSELLSVSLCVVELEFLWNSLALGLCSLTVSSQENHCKGQGRPSCSPSPLMPSTQSMGPRHSLTCGRRPSVFVNCYLCVSSSSAVQSVDDAVHFHPRLQTWTSGSSPSSRALCRSKSLWLTTASHLTMRRAAQRRPLRTPPVWMTFTHDS